MIKKIYTFIMKNLYKAKLLIWIFNHSLGMNIYRVQRKNSIMIKPALLNKTKIQIHGHNNLIVIEEAVLLRNCNIIINGDHNTVRIEKYSSLNHADICIENNFNEIMIGEGTSIHGATHLAAIEGTSLRIGQDCMFSGNVHFRTGDSHSIIDLDGHRINKSQDITIGNHVWIGSQVIGLKGISIADNSIIGAGSVLTKSFGESHVIIAGNPARIIKNDVDWLRERV
jgi:acetyltransferase-like isoleucine patch superfamily enzyme